MIYNLGLFFFLMILPFCAVAQIQVVNESMMCDSNSNVLEIGKFNYLRFKNLPEDAVVSVSDGIIKPDVKIKGRYYIPGQKTMEGKSINLIVTSTSKINFRKTLSFTSYPIILTERVIYQLSLGIKILLVLFCQLPEIALLEILSFIQ